MIKVNAFLPILSLFFFILFSCSDKDIAENNTRLANGTTYTLQVEDSLQIDYLGQLQLLDQNSRDELLLLDRQRSLYMVVNNQGDVIHQFIIKSDDRDFPGFMFTSPIFFQEDQIIFNGNRGLFFFDYDGNFLSKFEKPFQTDISGGMGGIKALHEIELEGERYLLAADLNFISGNPEEQSFYDDFRAVRLYHLATQEVEAFIELPPLSVYRDGRYHSNFRLAFYFDISGNRLALVFRSDPNLYIYQIKSGSFDLLEVIPLTEEVQYLDKQRPRNQEEKFDPSNMKRGESMLNAVALLDDGGIFVQYNPGLPEELREAPKIIDSEYGLILENPDNIPTDHYVLFQQGQKAGGGEMPPYLQRMLFAKDDNIWFSKTPNVEEEEDVITWYKVKITKQ